ncbi:hypothetical protein BZG36_02452 [Bifiguratus adelaidae]|uniref:PUM-HD domain-containing protein n=1 Tax=Bifiguratus adelaidae TaxID=1938954 RepID=A0A261Y3N9_9FUNG|nr:hypothetical protein BZG36_02452 [Bifiguratus adelaidae]
MPAESLKRKGSESAAAAAVDKKHKVSNDSNSGNANAGQPKGSAESRAEQKRLRIERRGHKPSEEIMQKAKKVWEKLRRADLNKDKAAKNIVMDEMMQVLDGRIQELILRHDASRVIQTCLKQGNAEHRNEIAKQLTGSYEKLSKSTYGKFLVTKIIEYCPQYRQTVLEELRHHVRTLIRHKEASTVIESFFVQYSTAAQRFALLSEFFGPEVTLFGDKSKEQPKSLKELVEAKPERREAIIKYLGDTLKGTVDKGTIQHSIVHKALLEYFLNADEKDCVEMMEMLKESIAEIVHTKEGSRVAMLCISYGKPKDRKEMVRALKPFLEKVATDEFGHMVLLRVFDVVDDTVLVSKTILAELLKTNADPDNDTLGKMIHDKYGRRVILYLLVGRNGRYLSHDSIQLLAEGDDIRSKTSKKDPQLRFNELKAYVSQPLLSYCTSHLNILIRSNLPGQVVTETILHADGDKDAILLAILDCCAQSPEEGGEEHIIEAVPRVIATIVKADTAAKEDRRADQPLNFAPRLLQTIEPNLLHFATCKGSFVVVALAEEPSTREQVLEALKPHKKALEELADEKGELKGASILLGMIRQ